MAINYSNKGLGLFEYLAAQGIILLYRDGQWVCDSGHTDDQVNAGIDAYPLSYCQERICKEIDAYAKELRDKVVVGVSAAELASWTIKANEATAYKATGLSTSAPTLNLEAQTRGVPINEIVNRVSANAPMFLGAEAMIAGTAGRHKDAVRLKTTFADVLSYDWRTGWPSV